MTKHSDTRRVILSMAAQHDAQLATPLDKPPAAAQWQFNAGVHYNPWADLTKEDFIPVAKAQKVFVGMLSCDTCGEASTVLPQYLGDRHEREPVRHHLAENGPAAFWLGTRDADISSGRRQCPGPTVSDRRGRDRQWLAHEAVAAPSQCVALVHEQALATSVEPCVEGVGKD